MYRKNVSTQDELAIRAVVERQLQAFQDFDAKSSFSLACPELQRQFRRPRTFMEMIKTSYQPVHRPRSVVFEGILYIQQRPALQMMLMTQKGTLIRALYMMQQQSDFSWRIAGCQLLPVSIEDRHRR